MRAREGRGFVAQMHVIDKPGVRGWIREVPVAHADAGSVSYT